MSYCQYLFVPLFIKETNSYRIYSCNGQHFKTNFSLRKPSGYLLHAKYFGNVEAYIVSKFNL